MAYLGEVYYCSSTRCYSGELQSVSYKESDNAFFIEAPLNDKLGVQSSFSIDSDMFKKLAVDHLGLVENTSKEANALFDATFGNAFLTVVMFYFIGKAVGLVLSFVKREALS